MFAHILGLGEWTILYYLKFLLVATAQAFLLVKSLVRCPRQENSMMAVALENSALSAWSFKVSADHIRSLDGLDSKPRLPFLLF